MAGKELTFKLVIDADTKDFVSNVQQSEKTAKALFDAIKIESDKLKTTSEETAKEVGKIVPDDLQKKADQAKGKLSEVSQAASELQGQAIEAAGKIDGLGNELQDTASKANKAGFEIGSAIPSDAVQLAEMLGNKFFSAAKEIESLGDKSTISAGELRAMSSAGEQGLNELNLALKAAQAELVRLQSTDGTLQDIEIAKQRVLSIQDAINEASSAFNYYQGVAINAMKGVDGATQSAINQVQRFSAVDLTGVVGEAQTATRAIESMGDGASLSTKEIERIGSIGTNSINALERELLTARNAFSALEQSSEAVTLNEIKAAGDKVKGLEQAVDLTKSAFSEFNVKATTAMQGVSTSTDKASGSAKQAGHAIYEALGIKPPSVINDAIADLTNKLENFKANSKLPAEEVARVTQATEQEIVRLKNELNGIEPAAQNANSGISGLSKGMDGAKFAVNALVGAMATVGIGLGIRELAQAADSYTNLSVQIQIATREGGDFTSAMAGVHQVALATNSSLDATAGLFTRLNTVGKEMGMTQQQALDLTKTVTQAIQIGGGSAQASEAAITQFIQAMQGGVLRGEEFNSIMENGYGLAEALARGLGVTTGELRKMAENGELTSERVVKAVQSQATQIQETYNQFPTTIRNALQKISTQWQILIGEMDQANGSSATVANALSVIADNLGILKVFFDDVAEGVGWFQDKLSEIDPSTIEAIRSTLSAVYDTIKTVISGMAGIAETAWSAFTSTLDAIAPLFNAIMGGKEEVSGLTTLFNVFKIALGVVSDGATGLNIALKLLLAGIQFISGGIYALSASVLDFLGFDDLAAQAQNASDALFRQAEKNGKEANRLALESKSATREAIREIRQTEDEANKERVAESQKTLNELKLQEEKHKADYKAISDERVQLEQQLHEARKTGNQAAIDQAVKGLAELDAKEKAYQAESQKITEAKIQAAQIVASAMIRSADAAGMAQLKVLNAQLAAQGLQAEFDSTGKVVVKAMQDATIATDGQVSATDKARKAAAALGIDLDVALNRVSKKFASDQNHLNSYAGGLEAMGVTGARATELIYQGWEKWAEQAKSPAEIDAAKAQLLSFEKQGVFSAKQVQMGMEHLDQVNGKLPQNISEVEKAYKLLGITSRKEAGEAADAQMRAFNVLKQSGTASVEELRQALINMADKVYASGDAVKIAAYEAKLAYHGLSKEVSETGQVSVKANNAVEESLHRVRNATSNAGDGFDDLGRRGVRAGNDTTEAWEEARKATEAAMASQGKMKASKTGTTAKHGLSVEEIEQRLKDIGYEGDTKQKAKQLFQDAEPVAGGYYKSASNEWVKKKYGTTAYDNQKALGNAMYVMEQIEKLEQYVGKSGRSANLGDYAPSIPSVPSTKDYGKGGDSVNYNIQFGGQTLSLTGDASQKDVMTNLVNQLKGIAKST
ncbi:tape measure protein [Acinetobacter variabilis]|uniref:tape measure protein n=1 Tax=Acinetobacter variabilis TaxID=70346 RepID=UPI0035D52667